MTIPLREGAESLNVAAAAAIALHEISSRGAGEGDG
jgi:tRNA G18 (ribose-2'-O)-methylase SpoU